MRCVRRCLRGSQARVWREAVRHWGTETGIASRRIGVFTTVDRDRESLVEGSSGQTSNTDGCRKYEQVARRKCGKVQSAGRATRSKQRWCGVLTTLRLALGGEAKPWLLVPVHSRFKSTAAQPRPQNLHTAQVQAHVQSASPKRWPTPEEASGPGLPFCPSVAG